MEREFAERNRAFTEFREKRKNGRTNAEDARSAEKKEGVGWEVW
jgi:hypothetical protein